MSRIRLAPLSGHNVGRAVAARSFEISLCLGMGYWLLETCEKIYDGLYCHQTGRKESWNKATQ